MTEDIRQRILYLRDVMHLSFYQIEDMTGVPRKRASKLYHGDLPGNKAGRPCRGRLLGTGDGFWGRSC
jgi:hypothetical protein